MTFRVVTFLCFLLAISINTKSQYVVGELIVATENEFDAQFLLEEAELRNPELHLSLKEALVPSENMYLLQFDTTNSMDAAIGALSKYDIVRYVQKNHTNISQRKSANDPNLIGQWYLNTIHAPTAWDISTGGFTADSQEIVVAIVDVSFEITHDDLKNNFWKNKFEIPNNSIDDDSNGYVDDYDGWNVYLDTGYVSARNPVGSLDKHGTQIAGIIGAVGNNGRDIAGLNWNIKMLPVQGSSTSESIVLKSYNYLLEMRKRYNRTNGDSGAFIVAQNSSFGVDKRFPADFPIWCDLIDKMGEAGIVSVAAGPNNLTDIDEMGDIPCTCPSNYLITVTRSDENDQLFSGGFGKVSMDLAAPGKDIFSTTPLNSTGSGTGSSFAAPMAAAAIGLMYAAYPVSFFNEDENNMALRSADYLNSSVEKLEQFSENTASGGRLDIGAALDIAQYAPPLSLNNPNKLAQSDFLYPNPNKGVFTFVSDKGGTLRVLTLNGSVLYVQSIESGENFIELDDLSSGLYLIEVMGVNIAKRYKVVIED